MSAGEISPDLYARADVSKYVSGLRTCRNFVIQRFGGAQNRAGSEFIGEVKDSSKTVRLIPFVFNTQQTYVLEFGNLYIRFIKEGSYVKDSIKTITSISKATEAEVTATSHGFSNGNEIHISGVTNPIEVNGRNFIVSDVTTNTFKLKLLDGVTYLDSSNYTTNSNGAASVMDMESTAASAARVYTIASTYIERDLADLKFVQSADVMTIVHQNYPPRELSRMGDANWSIANIDFGATIQPPTSPGTTGGAGGLGPTLYVITSISNDSFEESIGSSSTSNANIPAAANPVTVTWTLATNAVEYNIYKLSNGIYGFIGSAAGTSFIDTGIAADVSITPPTDRGIFELSSMSKTITNVSTGSITIVTSAGHGYSEGDLIFISGVVGTTQLNNLYFFVTNPLTNSFQLFSFDGTELDSSAYTAYISGGTAKLAHDYPATTAYFQQRLGFGNTRNEPETEWFSRTGLFHNFNISTPLQDDDAVTFQLVGRQVNGIHHMLDIGKLATLTQVGEWTIEGDAAGILLPTQINPKQQSYNGSDETIAPVVVDATALYVQARGSVLRDFNFNFQSDGYRGNDLSLFSAHLFDLYTILDITYQKIPHSNVWLVRDDGTLLGLTYVVEQNILGWHRHDFQNGLVENVCSVPEGNEDSLYLTIKRTVDGETKRYVEKLNTRKINDIEDLVLVDCSSSYDGTVSDAEVILGHGIKFTGGTTWDYQETFHCVGTGGGEPFRPTDVGKEIHVVGSDGTKIRCTITAYNFSFDVSIRPNRLVPVSMRDVEFLDYAFAVSTLTGLWHIEGESVSVFGDGFVSASANNAAYDIVTVSNGSISLSQAYAVIHIGLPITADVETLNVDVVQSETISDKKKTVNRVSLHVVQSRGMWVGSEPPSDDETDPLEGLVEMKLRNHETMDEPVELKTEVVDVIIRPEWNSNGRIFVRQVDPVPLTISAITVDGVYPFKN